MQPCLQIAQINGTTSTTKITLRQIMTHEHPSNQYCLELTNRRTDTGCAAKK